jgi:Rad3-related DNA helicase
LTNLQKDIAGHIETYWPNSLEEYSEAYSPDSEDIQAMSKTFKKLDANERDELLICRKLEDRITDMQTTLTASEDINQNTIRIREDFQNGFKVVMKPIDIGCMVGPKLKSIKKIILTSATLDSGLIERDLGIKATTTINEPSPFNYKANGLVYIPKTVPNPSTLEGNKTEWIVQVSREITQLIRASNGNGLVLFTSLAEMEEVLEYINENSELTQQIFTQGGGRRPDEVLQDFMKTDNSVLFGSKSFFEGIDIQGDKLQLVILTKLPFPIWGDPIVQAKKQQLGEMHFMQYYLPKMFVDLMQAAGRLIRTDTDRGVFAILDVRMWVGSNKKVDPETIKINNGLWPGYGNKAFKQLPFTNVTPNFSMVKKFLDHIHRS